MFHFLGLEKWTSMLLSDFQSHPLEFDERQTTHDDEDEDNDVDNDVDQVNLSRLSDHDIVTLSERGNDNNSGIDHNEFRKY